MDVRRLLASGALSGPYVSRRPGSRLLDIWTIAMLASGTLLLAFACLNS